MVWEFDWDGGKRKFISSTYRILVGKPVVKDTLGRVKNVWKDSVHTERTEVSGNFIGVCILLLM
jgi:hypothetical protein